MQDITIAGAQYADVPAVEFPKTGGGTARFVDVSDTTATAADVMDGKKIYLAAGSAANGSYVYSPLGLNPEFMQEIHSSEQALEDTLYASWTPSTTAKAIVATANTGTFVADMDNYEYLLRWKFEFDAVFPEGTTLKAAPVRECAELWQAIFKRPNSISRIRESLFNANVGVTLFSAPLLEYYNTSGLETMTYAITYGVYPAVTAPTFSNATSNTPTVTMKTPTVNARCHATYFSTAMGAAIDQTNSKYRLKGELCRVQKGTLIRYCYGDLIDIYNNGV